MSSPPAAAALPDDLPFEGFRTRVPSAISWVDVNDRHPRGFDLQARLVRPGRALAPSYADTRTDTAVIELYAVADTTGGGRYPRLGAWLDTLTVDELRAKPAGSLTYLGDERPPAGYLLQSTREELIRWASALLALS